MWNEHNVLYNVHSSVYLSDSQGSRALHVQCTWHIYPYDYVLHDLRFGFLFSRPSSEALSKACRDGIEAMGGQVTDYS